MLTVATLLGAGLVEPPLPMRQAGAVVSSSSMPVVSMNAPLGRRALLSSAATAVAIGSVGGSALPAFAEATLTTRQQAYTRYVPRIERGRDFWAGGLRKMIGSSDWDSIKKELTPVGKKGKGGAIPSVIGPMGLWASSWSSKVISDKTIAMNAAIDELNEAIASLEIAAQGEEKDGGLLSFLGGKKKIEEGARQKLAIAAYKKGVNAFNKYIEIGNDGLGLSFAPLDTID